VAGQPSGDHFTNGAIEGTQGWMDPTALTPTTVAQLEDAEQRDATAYTRDLEALARDRASAAQADPEARHAES
jgi:hypothetical protein